LPRNSINICTISSLLVASVLTLCPSVKEIIVTRDVMASEMNLYNEHSDCSEVSSRTSAEIEKKPLNQELLDTVACSLLEN